MVYNFIECASEQMYLMLVSIQDWLSEDHLAWFILDTVKQMDLEPFYRKCCAERINPRMMVSPLLHAYCLGGIHSSRQIERSCEVNVASRVITANRRPDYSTI